MDQSPALPDTFDMSTLPHLVHVPDLPVLNEQPLIDICTHWWFVEELLRDLVTTDYVELQQRLSDAIDRGLRGSNGRLDRDVGEPWDSIQINCGLPAMAHIARQLRRVGAIIDRCSSDEDRAACWAAARQLLTASKIERQRLIDEALPRVRLLAEQEAMEIQHREEEEADAEAEMKSHAREAEVEMKNPVVER